MSPYLTYRDTFDSERWLVTGKLVGDWQFDKLTIRPTVGVSFIEDQTEAYTDSLGVDIPSVRASLGQAVFGPEFIYRMLTPDGVFEPRLSIQGVWNFDVDHQATGVSLADSLDEELRAKIELGFRYTGGDGVSIDVSGVADGLGSSDYQEIGGKAAIRIPLN